jgi:hypothetical protein
LPIIGATEPDPSNAQRPLITAMHRRNESIGKTLQVSRDDIGVDIAPPSSRA